MSYIVVDVESDGPSPANYSMVCFGAVLVKDMDKTFYSKTWPINDEYIPEALAISGFSREEHKQFDPPGTEMIRFERWIKEVSQPPHIFISDNPAFDWQWINFYFDRYSIENPFGWSARRIGDLWCGMKKDTFAKWKHHRKTNHTHNPVDDAKGNAEVIHLMIEQGLKMKL